MHARDIKIALCIFRYLCVHLPKCDTLNIYICNSLCHTTYTCLAGVFDGLPCIFKNCILSYFSRSSILNICMHLYSFYLQVNFFKAGLSYEKWGPPPRDFVIPLPLFCGSNSSFHHDDNFTLPLYPHRFFDDLLAHRNPKNPQPIKTCIYIYPHIYNVYLSHLMHSAEPFSNVPPSLFSFFDSHLPPSFLKKYRSHISSICNTSLRKKKEDENQRKRRG